VAGENTRCDGGRHRAVVITVIVLLAMGCGPTAGDADGSGDATTSGGEQTGTPAESTTTGEQLDSTGATSTISESETSSAGTLDGDDGTTTGAFPDCEEERASSWTAISDAPVGRAGATAVWTGQEVVAWGGWGLEAYQYPVDALRYDLAADSWSVASEIDAPAGRMNHTAVWTGAEIIVWGGATADQFGTFDFLAEGGRYDPTTDSWQPMSEVAAPLPRMFQQAVWTGAEMIVWGGTNYNLEWGSIDAGARYDPTADEWSPMSTADSPSQRFDFASAWTGSDFFVWGGYGSVGPREWGPLGDGAMYDPAADVWHPITTEGAPEPTQRLFAAHIDGVVLIYGTGVIARYDPQSDAWIDASPNCDTRDTPSLVSTGDSILAWGGLHWEERPCWDTCWAEFGTEIVRVGADGKMFRAEPEGGPDQRSAYSTIWTDGGLWVWGGGDSPPYLTSGFLYLPPP
jgi:hypothetical protein